MACYHPIPAVQREPGAKVQFGSKYGTPNVKIPCGKCIGCRTDKAIEWGNRCEHEARTSRYNTFVTLTYAEETLPYGGHLIPKDLQDFLKRLRHHANRYPHEILTQDIDQHTGQPKGIRFFACGEYGRQRNRPHYHLILFNCDFPDKKQIGGTPEQPRYTSKILERIWGLGLVDIGNFTPAAATYIAKYTLKKWKDKWDTDDGYADENGEWHIKPQPFARMSLKPGIGTEWLRRYKNDLVIGSIITQQGTRARIPRTYQTRIKNEDPELHARIQYHQQEHRRRTPTDNLHPDRLEAAEIIAQQKHQRNEERRKF